MRAHNHGTDVCISLHFIFPLQFRDRSLQTFNIYFSSSFLPFFLVFQLYLYKQRVNDICSKKALLYYLPITAANMSPLAQGHFPAFLTFLKVLIIASFILNISSISHLFCSLYYFEVITLFGIQ